MICSLWSRYSLKQQFVARGIFNRPRLRMKQDSGSGGLEQFETTVSSRVARGVLGNNDSESRTRAEREQIKTTSLGCGRGYSLKKQQIMLTKWLR